MATGTVGTLLARLGLDAGPFNRGLKGARGSAGIFAGQIRKIMAGVGVAIAGAFSVRAIKGAFGAIDAQAKLATSLGTTSASMQVLTRAGELAGVSMQGVEKGSKDLHRRLSQAATGRGSAADALKRLGLSASQLLKLPLDQRLAKINGAIREFIPEAQRAAVAGALFGEEGAIAISRLDPETIAQASEEMRQFGFAISEVDADKIEAANDAMSALGLIGQGLVSRIAVAMAPALQAMAQGFAALMKEGGALRVVIDTLGANIGRIAAYVSTAAAIFAGVWVKGMAAAALGVNGLSLSLAFLRTAIIRTGIGLIIIGIGELVHQFVKLSGKVGGVGKAFALVGDVFSEVAGRIGTIVSGIGQMFVGLGMVIKEAFRSAFEWVKGAINDYIVIPFAKAINAVISVANSLGASFQTVDVPAASGSERGLLRSDGGAAPLSGADYITGGMNNIATAATTGLSSVEKLWAALGKTEETTKDVAIAADTLGDALDDAGSKGGGALDKVKGKAEALKDTTNQVRDSLKSAFVGLVTGAKNLKDALSEVVSKLADMAAEAAFDAIFGTAKKGGGGTGLLGWIASSLIPGFATGTDNAPGGLAMVGERGRELVNLPRGSQVIPNGRTEQMLRAGGGSLDVRVYVDQGGNWQAAVERISGPVARAEVRAAAPQIVGSAVAQVGRVNRSTKRALGI